jgi:hypothetical protein
MQTPDRSFGSDAQGVHEALKSPEVLKRKSAVAVEKGGCFLIHLLTREEESAGPRRELVCGNEFFAANAARPVIESAASGDIRLQARLHIPGAIRKPIRQRSFPFVGKTDLEELRRKRVLVYLVTDLPGEVEKLGIFF